MQAECVVPECVLCATPAGLPPSGKTRWQEAMDDAVADVVEVHTRMHSGETFADFVGRVGRAAIAVYRELMEPPTAETVRLLLGLVASVEIPPADVVAAWSEDTRGEVARWAGLVHLSASDHDDIEVPPMPAVLDPYRRRPGAPGGTAAGGGEVPA